MAFTPSVEVGIRQDGGEAEVGRGLDVGLGLLLADGVTCLDVDVWIRRPLVHQAAVSSSRDHVTRAVGPSGAPRSSRAPGCANSRSAANWPRDGIEESRNGGTGDGVQVTDRT